MWENGRKERIIIIIILSWMFHFFVSHTLHEAPQSHAIFFSCISLSTKQIATLNIFLFWV
jgi:hypothetical protein